MGFMPVDGLLGNNVWSRFTLEIDYPADVMVLHDPNTVDPPRGAAPMFFDNAHVYTPIDVRTPGELSRVESLIAQVDTGASELTLCAATGLPFKDAYTQGLETVRGIGASETLPPFRFLEMTRRIPLQSVRIGGTEVEVDLPARWMAYENTRTTSCGGMKALIGHEYLAAHRVWFDYTHGKIALRKSRRPARQLNGHQVLYDQEVAAFGDDPAGGWSGPSSSSATGRRAPPPTSWVDSSRPRPIPRRWPRRGSSSPSCCGTSASTTRPGRSSSRWTPGIWWIRIRSSAPSTDCCSPTARRTPCA